MKIRDRIRELRRVRAGDLIPNPKNWRTHPKAQQDALRGILAEVGYADALLARETPEGGLMLIDGHLRAETTPDELVPVLVLDVNEAEASKLLAVLDPLAGLAEADGAKLDALLREVKTGDENLQAMLSGLAEENGIIPGDDKPTQLKQFSTLPPTAMSWCLIGIPTVRYGEIAADMERIGLIDGIVCETTANNG